MQLQRLNQVDNWVLLVAHRHALWALPLCRRSACCSLLPLTGTGPPHLSMPRRLHSLAVGHSSVAAPASKCEGVAAAVFGVNPLLQRATLAVPLGKKPGFWLSEAVYIVAI